ncbi:hypothetical protein GQ44DRAFT_757451 [Phaeosphaeriaceae sp. PMI808]|nr:hypothetical protein GQ44DRAFT_757451 [Phaeosphaeriaceae sp. PMI808]
MLQSRKMGDKECVVCSRPGDMFCEYCAKFDDTGIPSKVCWYCSPLCRAVDKRQHQAICWTITDRKNLLERAQRAGRIAQTLFYTFLEETWAYDMSDVRIISNRHDDLTAIEVCAGPGQNTGPGGESTCQQKAGGWLVSFPVNKFGPADWKAKRSLLADRHSVWTFVFMMVAVQILFQDLVNDAKSDIKEIVHYLADTTRRFVTHKGRFGFKDCNRDDFPYTDEDASGDLKGVYRITLKDGTNIALDLAGQQYSALHDTIMPWATYCDRWVTTLKYRIPLGSHYGKHIENMSSYHYITHLTVVMEQIILFNNLLQDCESKLGFNLRNVTEESNTVNLRKNEDFVTTAAKDSFQKHAHDLDNKTASCLIGPIDLRHPKAIENLATASDHECGEFILPDLSTMKSFSWLKLSQMIRMPGDAVPLAEKRKARFLLKHYCAYTLPGSSRLVFLMDGPASNKIPLWCISENTLRKRR